MKIFNLILLLLVSNLAHSQIFTNSQGNGVFFTDKAKQLKLNTQVSEKSTEADIQFNFSPTFFSKIQKYKINKTLDKDTVNTLYTSYGFTGKIGVVNDKNLTEGIKNPSWILELGVVKGLDSINRAQFIRTGVAWGVSIKTQLDKDKVLYDFDQKVESNKDLLSYSLNTHFEFYPSWCDFISFGVTAGYINSTNYDDLDSFQKKPLSYEDENITSIVSSPVGKIGNSKRVNNGYYSLSIPTSIFSQGAYNSRILDKLVYTPYIHQQFGDNDVKNIGMMLSVTNQVANSKNMTSLFDSSFNFGVDWIHEDNWSKPVWFFGGVFALNELVKKYKAKIQE